jgi:hypothetical protein
VGDDALAEAALRAAVRQCGTGLRWPERPLAAGAAGLGGHLITRWSTPVNLAELNVRGYQPPTGPVLSLPDDSDVIVVLARSGDGASLDACLQPRETGTAERVELRFSGLDAGGTYRLTGPGDTTVTADEHGRATASVTLTDLTELRLAPAGDHTR